MNFRRAMIIALAVISSTTGRSEERVKSEEGVVEKLVVTGKWVCKARGYHTLDLTPGAAPSVTTESIETRFNIEIRQRAYYTAGKTLLSPMSDAFGKIITITVTGFDFFDTDSGGWEARG